MQPSPSDLLSELRRSTREQHAAIEATLALDDALDRERYGAILCTFDAFLRPWEEAVRAALPPRLRDWFDARRRSPLAAADLAFLRLVSPPDLRERARGAVDGLPLQGLAQALGSMYVIEGSALGGQVIGPRLARDLSLSAGRGASYFNGFGDRTGAMWREFRECATAEIDASGGGAAAIRAACLSARRTFESLTALFAPALA